MNRTRPRPFLAAALAAFALNAVALADPPADKLNQRVAKLSLPGPDGKPVAVAAPTGGAAVVVFLSFDCPVSNSYAAPLAELAKQYADRGVKVFGVAAGEEPTDALAKKAAEFKLGFPLLADPMFAAADALKANVVSEAFVLDDSGTLRYRGRIDDGYSARLKRNPAVTSHDLRDAIDAVLAGKPVPHPATKAVGCAIVRPEPDGGVQNGGVQPRRSPTVTFHRDVMPILQAHCQSCHRPGQAGPFSLTNYKQAVAWAADIKEYTHNKQMPPWKPVGGPGYTNDRRMPDKDIATLAAWADAGCPEGNPKDAPPTAAFPNDWQLGEPDLVLTVPEDMHVGPSGKDLFRCFVLPTGLTEDKYVVGYEVRPGNPRVVHHTLNFWDRTGKARELADKEAKRAKAADEPDHGPGYPVTMGLGFIPTPVPPLDVPPTGGIGGWAPGQRAMKVPDGAGFFLPKGADMVIQTHYHRTGKPETDRVSIGLYFAKKPIEKRWQTITLGGMALWNTIPAGESAYKAKGSVWLGGDATLYSVMPHMHLIGRAIKVTMTPPGGDPVTLVDVPDWDYNWQETYWFKDPIRVKTGTRFDVEAVYDNSSANPNNPSNPPRRVFFGEQTTNEMLFAFLGLTPDKGRRVPVERVKPTKKVAAPNADTPADAEKPTPKAAPQKGAKAFEVPYRLTDTKHVLIRAKLNGKGPFNFILDTGAPTVFLSKKVADQAGLKTDADGWGTFDRFEIEGGVVADKTRGRAENLFQLEGMNGMGLAGVELHGVIGYTVLAKYRITFDFTKDKLTWVPLDYDPPPLNPVGKGGQGELDAVGPLMKVLAGFLGITPKFDPVPRGRLGVEVADRNGGVVVTGVLAGTAAAKAGLKPGDAVARVGDKPVTTEDGLRKALADSVAGADVSLTVVRGGAEVPVKVTLEGGL